MLQTVPTAPRHLAPYRCIHPAPGQVSWSLCQDISIAGSPWRVWRFPYLLFKANRSKPGFGQTARAAFCTLDAGFIAEQSWLSAPQPSREQNGIWKRKSVCLTWTKGLQIQPLRLDTTLPLVLSPLRWPAEVSEPGIINTGLMLKPGGGRLQPHPSMSAGWRWVNSATWQKVHASSPAVGTQAWPDLIETRSSTERQHVVRHKHCWCRVNALILFEQGWTSAIQDTWWYPVWFWSGSRNLTNTLIARSSPSLRFACTDCASHFPKSCRAARKRRAA